MSRRILDSISIDAIKATNDSELLKGIIDIFGEGTLVKDAKTKSVRFDKSDFGLKKFSIYEQIKSLSKELLPDMTLSTKCEIIDSSGDSHAVTPEAISILKAMSIYSLTCPIPVSKSIKSILKEIDSFYIREQMPEAVSLLLEEDSSITSNEHLLNFCRSEIHSLLKEAGVTLE